MSWLPISEPHGILGDITGGINALNKVQENNALRKIKEVQAQYAPLTTQAEAASKLAYSNLMGPQFLAKAFSDPNFLAGLDENQKANAINIISRAATGTNPLQQMQMLQDLNQSNQPPSNPLKALVGNIKDAFGFGEGEKEPNNAMLDIPIPARRASNAMNQQYQPSVSENALNGNIPGNVATPEEVREIAYGNKQPEKTLAEKRAESEKVIEQGKKQGTYNAEAVGELGKEYKALGDLDRPYNTLKEVYTDNDFKDLMKIPAFRNTQLDLLKNYNGTKKQKALIAKLETAIGAIQSNIVQSMGKSAPASEIAFADKIKIPRNETVDVAIPKLKTLMEFKEFQKERVKTAADLIEDEHISQRKAFELADKNLNGDKIRAKIESQFEPTEAKITEDDIDFTAKKYHMTREQVIQKLKGLGKYNG